MVEPNSWVPVKVTLAPLLRLWPLAPLAVTASSVCNKGKAVPLAGRLVVKFGVAPFAMGSACGDDEPELAATVTVPLDESVLDPDCVGPTDELWLDELWLDELDPDWDDVEEADPV